MATATRTSPSTVAAPAPNRQPSFVLRAFDATFRFLASLKLAVICLATLSATLAYGTKFNSDYGQAAVNEYIYQTRGFALLLAFLGINILCAALIRYPWTKRQTGFVITHAGLLIVIASSWVAARSGNEGMLGLREGETSGELVLTHKPVLYVRPVDPHTGQASGTFRVPVYPGAFDWKPGRYEVVSRPSDPFKLAIKGYYAASIPAEVVKPDPAGVPMLKLRPRIIPPGQTVARDVIPSEHGRWFDVGSGRARRVVKDAGPAQFVFAFADRPEFLDDFLDPPADPGQEGVARLRYVDKAGRPRKLDVRVDDAKVGEPIPLPDSDLTASFAKVIHLPIEDPAQRRDWGDDGLNIVQFNVKQGSGPEVEHNGFASMPNVPPVIPKRDAPGESPKPLLQIGYFHPPEVDPKTNGRFGVVEVMGDASGRLGYRVFERGTPGKLRSSGLLKLGQVVTAFGGNALAPMTLTFAAEEFLQGGREEEIAESIDLPPGQKENQMSAVLAEMTVGGVTRDVWLRKSPGFDPDYKTLAFADAMYEVAFDVDRLDLGFTLRLDDFDVGYDPGTKNAASYRSEVSLTDESMGLKDAPRSIFMNNTIDHRGWRFFQTNYAPYVDPKTRRPTGEFVSTFQVAKNPARVPIYFGCIVVVLGAFVQFYMRAGIFTDGGKREREKAAAKARRLLETKAGRAASPAPALTDDDEPL